MSDPKLVTALECAAYLARRLSPLDELAIVTFDHRVRLELPLSPVGAGGGSLEQPCAASLRAAPPTCPAGG